jgi:hypothetical protein
MNISRGDAKYVLADGAITITELAYDGTSARDLRIGSSAD